MKPLDSTVLSWTLVIGAFVSWPCAAQLSYEEYRRSTSPESQLEKALHVLDNPKWYDTDDTLRAILKNNARQEPAKRDPDPISRFIRERELTSLGIVLQAGLPPEELRRLLIKYLTHHNPQVAQYAYEGLVEKRLWSIEKSIDYARTQSSPATWASILKLRGDGRSATKELELARTYVLARLAERPPSPSPNAYVTQVDSHFDAEVCAVLVRARSQIKWSISPVWS